MALLNLIQILPHIPCAALTRRQWVEVGMALKMEGCTWQDWDAWSASDAVRYHPGECERLWKSFKSDGITGGTVVHLAKQFGWSGNTNAALTWDNTILANSPSEITYNPATDLRRYLQALFKPDDFVSYVMQSVEHDGRFIPSGKGVYSRRSKDLLAALDKTGGDIAAALGDYSPSGGAWIRFNPVDGKGVGNDNITELRFCLVESDTVDIQAQERILRQSKLPIAAMIHSGGKSVHAIVRVEASNPEEYRKRVCRIYDACKAIGLEVDEQNKNPSRLSRMPGIRRGEELQRLLAVKLGCRSYADWEAMVQTRELPAIDDLDTLEAENPPLAPELIAGVLRKGHKMLLAAPSKAGKSFLLIQLVIAIAEGHRWLGKRCAKGKVLYVNFELDRASCYHRFRECLQALGIRHRTPHNIHIWNLRGHSCAMTELTDKFIHRAGNENYTAIVIDPIYKVITGDENAASEMAAFCNEFDRLATQLGCAVIFCHHHSKGAQGAKKSMDRASGSGVFARDPDALLDMIELSVTEEALQILADSGGEKPPPFSTAWRVECTLREFPRFAPVNLWFNYPIHMVDEVDALTKCEPADSGRDALWREAKDKQETERQSKRQKLKDAIENANFGAPPTPEQVAAFLQEPKVRSIICAVNAGGNYYINKSDGRIYPR